MQTEDSGLTRKPVSFWIRYLLFEFITGFSANKLNEVNRSIVLLVRK